MEFFQLGFEPVVEISAEHGHGRGGAARRDRRSGSGARGSGLGDSGRSDDERRVPSPEPRIADGDRRRHRRAAERRQVVARQPAAARRARARQRHAGHDARRDRRRAARGIAAASASSTRRACGGRDASGRGGKVEVVSVAGAKKAIADADVVALVIDASTGATDQDAAIGGEADRAGRGVVIVANKWDLVKERGRRLRRRRSTTRLRHRMRFLDYAPILHISALTGERTAKVLETIDKIAAARRQRIPTPALNKFVEAVTAANPPVSPGASTCGSCTPRRSASRRRRSSSSPTWRRRFISRTSGS